MYSDNDIKVLAQNMREKIKPKEVIKTEDIMLNNNQIMLDYIINDNQLDEKEISELLNDFKELNNQLTNYAYTTNEKPELNLKLGMIMPDPFLYHLLNDYTERTVIKIKNQLITGKKEPYDHKISNTNLKIFIFKDQLNANKEIAGSALTNVTEEEIYIRLSSIHFQKCMMKKTETYKNLSQKEKNNLEDNLIKLKIGHELKELEQYNKNELSQDFMTREIESEKGALEYGKNNNISTEFYKTVIDALKNEQEKNLWYNISLSSF
ncbi:hypothetical protein K9L97_03870 [Candidatus Woesearchaeota archaeon]|nr:hypothetical protein [Candidatus Woesearchaeota archaeon]